MRCLSTFSVPKHPVRADAGSWFASLHRQIIRLCLTSVILGTAALSVQSAVPEPGKSLQLASLDETPKGLAKSDWQSIREAYEAGRHAFQPTEGKDGHWHARNPGQQWFTTFDQRGFESIPQGGSWTWGLELQSYGFGDLQQAVCGTPKVKAEGQHLSYQWDDNVQEWFINDQRGLEHGFTVAQRPSFSAPSHSVTSAPSLSFNLTTRGGLRPVITADAQGVSFQDASGVTMLNYTGLKVWDADGKKLPSRFEAVGLHGFRILVDEGAAHYPITIDPIAQQAYLKANNSGEEDHFGCSVAVSGDTAIVGAFFEDSNATTVNGDGNNNSATDSGAAYVFTRSGTIWTQQAYLKANNSGEGDRFGRSVALSGDTAVIGAHKEDSNATTVNGGGTNNSATDSGSAYVFIRRGSTWTQQAYLKANNSGEWDLFGWSVAVSGDTAIIGATGEDSNATTVGGDGINNSAAESGATYIFTRNGSIWTQQAYLKANNSGRNDNFGWSVAISGDTAVIGAPEESSDATTVNGNGSNERASYAGAAYVFSRSGTSWTQQAYLKARNSGAGDNFGASVAVSGDTVVIGAPGEDSIATSVNGDGSDDSLDESGAAYVFTRNGTHWTQQAYLKARNSEKWDDFGNSVVVSGDAAIIGAPSRNTARSGAAYVFMRYGTSWHQETYLKASNFGMGDYFGWSVAMSGDTAVIGAFREDSNATTVDGDGTNNSAANSGAAYTFSGLGPSTQFPRLDSHTWWHIPTNTTILYLSGSGFSTTPGNIKIVFTPSGTGVVTAITDNVLTVSNLSGLTLGPLNAVVTINGQSSGTPVQIGTVAYSPPHDIMLSTNTLAENMAANSTVGTLSSADVDAGDTFTYTLVEGIGSADNASFNISGNELRLTASPDYESKSIYTVLVRSTDTANLSFKKSFTIRVINLNEAPTDLALSTSTLTENVAANTTVGTLSSADPDAGSTFTYTLVEGIDSTDNSAFNISGNALRITSPPDFETQNSYLVRVRTTDAGGLSFENSFIISIVDVPPEPVITINGKGQLIANGDMTPSTADDTDFGSVILINKQATRFFTITNGGDTVLNLASTPVVLNGLSAADFKVTALPNTSVAGGATTTFAITFDPSLPGMRTATVTINSNAVDHPSFSFAITGFSRLSKLLSQKITFAPPATVYLDQSTLPLMATSSSGLPVTLSILPSGTKAAGAGLIGNVLSFTGIGTVKVKAVQTGSSNYAAAPTVVKTITVKANPVPLTLLNLAQIYTGTPREISTLGGTGSVALEYKIWANFGSTAPTDAGSYSVRATDSKGTKTGTLVISKAPLYVMPSNQRKFVGQDNPALSLSYTGWVNGQTDSLITTAPILKTTATKNSVGGVYPITASGGVAPANYKFIYLQGSLVVETFAGSYEALLRDSSDVLLGKLAITTSATNTSFSGKLSCKDEKAALSFTDALQSSAETESATGSASVSSGGIPYVITVTTRNDGSFSASVTRDGEPYANSSHGRYLLQLAKTQTVLYRGAHTAVLEPAVPAADAVPVGAGWATASVSSKGVMTLAGRLGDGTDFTSSVMPDDAADPSYRLFVQPYKTGKTTRTRSHLSGPITLQPHPASTPALAGRRYAESAALTWVKAGLSTDTAYRTDFGPVSTVLMLDPWLAPQAAKGKVPAITLAGRLGLTNNSFEVQHSDTGSTLNEYLPSRVGFSSKHLVSLITPAPTANSTKWKVKLDVSKGTFSGSFELADIPLKPRVATFSGVLRQPASAPDTLIGDGHYLLPPLTGTEKKTGEILFLRP